MTEEETKEERHPDECPKCGNPKHKEIKHIHLEDKESHVWRCKACGYTDYDFSEYADGKDKESIERMGDAFREYLKK